MRKKLWLILFALLSGSCQTVTIPNVKDCIAAGKVSYGAICAESETGITTDMTPDEFIAFLEANATKGAAVCQSSIDYGAQKTALDEACRLLGSSCTKEIKTRIAAMKRVIERLDAIKAQMSLEVKP